MPIIIEEMTVQVEVNQGSNSQQPASAGTATGDTGNSKEIIRKAVEEVMEVIRHQNER